MIWVLTILQLRVELFVIEIYVRYTREILDTFRGIFAKFVPHNAALLKLHDVLREGACLITEDVVHHAQLLVEVG